MCYHFDRVDEPAQGVRDKRKRGLCLSCDLSQMSFWGKALDNRHARLSGKKRSCTSSTAPVTHNLLSVSF